MVGRPLMAEYLWTIVHCPNEMRLNYVKFYIAKNSMLDITIFNRMEDGVMNLGLTSR